MRFTVLYYKDGGKNEFISKNKILAVQKEH